MKRFLKFGGILTVVAFVVTGCEDGGKGPANEAAYQKNSTSCSSEFVSDYNRVTTSLKSTSTYGDLDQAESLVNDFSSKYQGVVCNASISNDNRLDPTPTTVDANAKVKEWKSLITSARGQDASSDGNRNPNPATPAEPITSIHDPTRDVKVSSLVNGIILEVTDDDAFNKFANGGASVFIQKGKSADEYSFDRNADLCYLRIVSGAATYKNGDRISMTIKVVSNKLTGVALPISLNLGCLKLSNKYDDWKLRDLDNVFVGVAKVIVE